MLYTQVYVVQHGDYGPGRMMTLEFLTTAASQAVLIPLQTAVNVSIDWGDGSAVEVFTMANPTHTYATAGTYTVTVSGSAGQLGNSAPDARWTNRVQACLSFGDLVLTSLAHAFRSVVANVGMPSTIPATVTDMNLMFYLASAFNQPIGQWDVSSVTDMVSMFYNADVFNQDISGWDFTGLDGATDLDNFMGATPGLSPTNYDALLIAWSAMADATMIYTPLSPDMGCSTYSAAPSAAATARADLIAYGWDITDCGPVEDTASGLEAYVRASFQEDAGSILESTEAIPSEVSASMSFDKSVNLPRGSRFGFPHPLNAGTVLATAYPYAVPNSEHYNTYVFETKVSRMARTFPPKIWERVDKITSLASELVDENGTADPTGDRVTAQAALQYIFDQWTATYDWFTAEAVPDLRTWWPSEDYSGTNGVP